MKVYPFPFGVTLLALSTFVCYPPPPFLHAFKIVLYFDGSLHHSLQSRIGKNQKKTPSIAIASAAIYTLVPSYLPSSECICECIGYTAHPIPIYPQITSADVEYDGFLLALQQLQSYLTTTRDSRNIPSHHDGDVIIRGDCKTVIDQMNGHSIPRKLRQKHTQALQFIQRMKQQQHSKETTSSPTNDNNHQPYAIHFVYQHVTRDKNIFCDWLCKDTLYKLQRQHMDTYVEFIQNTTQNVILSKNTTNHKFMIWDPKSKKYISSSLFLSMILQNITNVDEIHLPMNWRPTLYFPLASFALDTRDPITLYHIGQLLAVKTSTSTTTTPTKHVPSTTTTMNSSSSTQPRRLEDIQYHFFEMGILLQYIGGIHLPAYDKDIKLLFKKYSTLLQSVDTTSFKLNDPSMDSSSPWMLLFKEKMYDLYLQSMSIIVRDSMDIHVSNPICSQ